MKHGWQANIFKPPEIEDKTLATNNIIIIKMRYKFEPRENCKIYAFLSFAKNIGSDLSCKYTKKLLDSA